MQTQPPNPTICPACHGTRCIMERAQQVYALGHGKLRCFLRCGSCNHTWFEVRDRDAQ